MHCFDTVKKKRTSLSIIVWNYDTHWSNHKPRERNRHTHTQWVNQYGTYIILTRNASCVNFVDTHHHYICLFVSFPLFKKTARSSRHFFVSKILLKMICMCEFKPTRSYMWWFFEFRACATLQAGKKLNLTHYAEYIRIDNYIYVEQPKIII
jgi:hypothetical protein